MKTTSTPHTWTWTGVDAHGTKVQGETHAPSLRLARAELRRQGIQPQHIRRQRVPLSARFSRGISGKEIAIFTRQLVTMISAGIPLLQALKLIGTSIGNPHLAQTITTIARDIAHGTPIHEALARHPAGFDPLYQHLVRVGEGTGRLDAVLERIASERERREQLKGRIIKALVYPAAVLAMALLVTLVMLIYVVPQFAQTFQGMGAELPAFTQAIIASSRWMGRWWWALLAGCVLTGFGLVRAWRNSPQLRERGDRLMLRLPMIGNMFSKLAVARFARTLATTVQAGVPLVEALTIIAAATGNRIFARATSQMVDKISVGGSLEAAMHGSRLFPPMAVQMVAIGEEAGALDTMLHKLAGFYEEEIGNAVDALSSLVEPAVMLVIGVLVGGLVIGMYLPVFNLAPAL